MKRFAVVAVLPFILAACSNFETRWKNEQIASRPGTLAGKWTGAWQSYTGHRGDLRAIIVPDAVVATTQPDARVYHATFQAKWGLLNAAEYTVDFTATPTSDGEKFTGSKNLGLEGVYHYDGVLRQDDLQSTYKATRDHGAFILHRVSNPK